MLKRNSVLLFSAFVIPALLFSLSAALAYPDMAINGSNNTSTPEVAISSYGANIVIIQHLIEVDQVTYPGYFRVVETIIYKNLGTEDYSGPVYTYVQDGAFNIAVVKLEMAAGRGKNTIEAFQVSENVVGWNDIIPSGTDMAPMYQIEYMVPAGSTGKTTESVTFTKKLKYQTNVNYIYMAISGMPAMVVKLEKSDRMKTTVLDNDGSDIKADFFEVIGNSETYNWLQPQFSEISFELSELNLSKSEVTAIISIPTSTQATIKPAETIINSIRNSDEQLPQQDKTNQIIAITGSIIIFILIILLVTKSLKIKKKINKSSYSSQIPLLNVIPKFEMIDVKRGYEVLSNNDIRFGIKIINNTDYTITDIEIILDYDNKLFLLRNEKIFYLGHILPKSERTEKFILTPISCIHNEMISATIFCKDHTGEKHIVQMRPKDVHCVSPFLKEKPMFEGEFAEFATKSKYIEIGLSFSGIGIKEIGDIIKSSCTHRLSVVGEHEVDKTTIINLAGESIGEKAYYLLTGVIQPYNDVTQVALRAYSDRPHGLHGFLNEIAMSIRHLVSSIQSAREIGIIENKQVINIIDSVVQRTNFKAMSNGSVEVNIEDSIIQRSNFDTTKDENIET